MGCRVARISSITGLGNHRDSCAAILAGLTGVRGSANFELFFQGDEEPRPVSVCAVPVVTQGFSGIGRLVALLHQSLGDLFHGVREPGELLDLPWFVAFPDPWERAIETADLEREDEAAARVAWLAQTVTERAMTAAKLEAAPKRCRFYGGDQAAFAAALSDALAGFRQGTYRRCVVGAVDSLLSLRLLEELAAGNLLRTPKNQYGLVPGEGAVLILLEAGGTAAGGRTISIESVSRSAKIVNAERGDGRALAQTIVNALELAGTHNVAFSVISDQNGERERAYEWGDALVQLAARGLTSAVRAHLTHAMNVGDTGVCAPAVGVALGAYAMSRRRMTDRIVATASAFDPPVCAAVVLTGN
jgi:3-oxoacyl-[acyl-carrier-protein] synthase I